MGDPGKTPIAAGTLLPIVMVLIGAVILIRTLLAGGGIAAQGVILGVLFMLAGAGRFYIGRTRRP